MKHIKQKYKWDCCIASIAMMVGCEYEEVFEAFKELFPKHKKNGLSDDEIFELLIYFKQKPKLIDDVILGVAGIIFLPSKNEPDGSHAVYFDGEKIFDPNNGRRGKKFYNHLVPKFFPADVNKVVNMKDKKTKEIIKMWDQIQNGK